MKKIVIKRVILDNIKAVSEELRIHKDEKADLEDYNLGYVDGINFAIKHLNQLICNINNMDVED